MRILLSLVFWAVVGLAWAEYNEARITAAAAQPTVHVATYVCKDHYGWPQLPAPCQQPVAYQEPPRPTFCTTSPTGGGYSETFCLQ